MRITSSFIVTGVLGFASVLGITGCEPTDSATKSDHRVEIKIDELETGGHVSIIIKQDDNPPTIIMGPLSNPEIQKQLSLLDGETLEMMNEADGKVQAWLERSDDADKRFIEIDIEKTVSGEHEVVLVEKGDVHEDGERIIIVKDDISHADMSESAAADAKERYILIIKGDSDEDVRQQLKEHGIDLDALHKAVEGSAENDGTH